MRQISSKCMCLNLFETPNRPLGSTPVYYFSTHTHRRALIPRLQQQNEPETQQVSLSRRHQCKAKIYTTNPPEKMVPVLPCYRKCLHPPCSICVPREHQFRRYRNRAPFTYRGNTPVSPFTLITPSRAIPRERGPREASAPDRWIFARLDTPCTPPPSRFDGGKIGCVPKACLCHTPEREKDRVSSVHLSFADPPLDTQHNKTSGPTATRCYHAIGLSRQATPP